MPFRELIPETLSRGTLSLTLRTGYIVKNGEPLLPPGMRELLYKDLDRGFDF